MENRPRVAPQVAFVLAVVAAGHLPGALASAASAADDYTPFRPPRNWKRPTSRRRHFSPTRRSPGAQHLAVAIGRARPAEYLALLAAHEDKIPTPLAKVIEGDLRLATADKPAALACYRAVAKMAATKDDQGWATGHVPADAYVVEPAARETGRQPS